MKKIIALIGLFLVEKILVLIVMIGVFGFLAFLLVFMSFAFNGGEWKIGLYIILGMLICVVLTVGSMLIFEQIEKRTILK